MATRLLGIDKIERRCEFNIVDGLHFGASEPESYKILSRSQQNFAEEETRPRGLTSLQADELPFLCCVCVDHAVAAGIVENDGEIGRRKVRFALKFDVDAQV